MIGVIKNKETHTQRLARWVGEDRLLHMQRCMWGDGQTGDGGTRWYGPPMAVAGVPGRVFLHNDGSFSGPITSGQFANAVDWSVARLRRIWKDAARRAMFQHGMGFASLSALISAATGGNLNQNIPFQKVGVTGVLNVTNTLWFEGNQPAAGGAAGAAAGGTAWTSASTGAISFTNPTTGTTHFIRADVLSSVAAMTLMIYDRLFSVTKTMNSTATEAVTGVPTRYQSTTATAADYVGGNFLMIETRVVLPATAHNWTVCLYTDQAAASSTLPSVTGNSAAIAKRLDQPAGQWFCPLESGDAGIKAITQMQCSALVATGNIDFTIGRPIAMVPCPIANIVCTYDGLNTAFNLVRIYDNACLSFLEPLKSATTATTYTGTFQIVSG